jgi:hypothetical protein
LKLPIILGTQDQKNLVFYGRLGFILVDTAVYEEKEEVPKKFISYFMIREPIHIENNSL